MFTCPKVGVKVYSTALGVRSSLKICFSKIENFSQYLLNKLLFGGRLTWSPTKSSKSSIEYYCHCHCHILTWVGLSSDCYNLQQFMSQYSVCYLETAAHLLYTLFCFCKWQPTFRAPKRWDAWRSRRGHDTWRCLAAWGHSTDLRTCGLVCSGNEAAWCSAPPSQRTAPPATTTTGMCVFIGQRGRYVYLFVFLFVLTFLDHYR